MRTEIGDRSYGGVRNSLSLRVRRDRRKFGITKSERTPETEYSERSNGALTPAVCAIETAEPGPEQ